MSKSTVTYWNAFDKSNEGKWETIEDSDGQLEQLLIVPIVLALYFLLPRYLRSLPLVGMTNLVIPTNGRDLVQSDLSGKLISCENFCNN